MIYARIAGTGSCLPGNPVSNEDLVARGIDTSDEWIVSRSGIRSRYLAAPMSERAIWRVSPPSARSKPPVARPTTST